MHASLDQICSLAYLNILHKQTESVNIYMAMYKIFSYWYQRSTFLLKI